MVTLSQVQSGVAQYIETEVLSKVPDWRKWVLGAGVGVIISKSSEIFEQLKANPIISAMGVIDANDMIDIDRLYNEFAKQAQKQAVTFEVPLLGAVTLNAHDVDLLYRYIKGGVNV